MIERYLVDLIMFVSTLPVFVVGLMLACFLSAVIAYIAGELIHRREWQR